MDFEQIVNKISDLTTEYAPKIALALLTLILG